MEDLAALTRRPGPGTHRMTILVDGRSVETLADLPPLRNRLLFVGLHPTPVSVAAGHYHQGRPGRTFWRRLAQAEVVGAELEVEAADDDLVARGHGITDLIKLPTTRDPRSDDELLAGVGRLWQKVAIWRPAAVVFIDRRAASISAGRDLTERWGQVAGMALAGRPCFLMPGRHAPREEVDEGLNFLRNLASALPGE
jgi:double-stranded uracil-DNA glycosylase